MNESFAEITEGETERRRVPGVRNPERDERRNGTFISNKRRQREGFPPVVIAKDYVYNVANVNAKPRRHGAHSTELEYCLSTSVTVENLERPEM